MDLWAGCIHEKGLWCWVLGPRSQAFGFGALLLEGGEEPSQSYDLTPNT
jgi:hypothetical protein